MQFNSSHQNFVKMGSSQCGFEDDVSQPGGVGWLLQFVNNLQEATVFPMGQSMDNGTVRNKAKQNECHIRVKKAEKELFIILNSPP